MKIFFAVTFINWFVFFAAAIVIGGVALGTEIDEKGYYVSTTTTFFNEEEKTSVSASVWFYSLLHTYATFALTPLSWACFAGCLHRVRRRTEDEDTPAWTRRTATILTVAFSLFSATMLFTMTSDLIDSLSSWRRMG